MDIFVIASWVGSAAFALSGFLIGARQKLDVMGVFILAMLTANGGGAIRDVLVGRTPFVLQDYASFLLVWGVVSCGYIFKLHQRDDVEKSGVFILSDSLGLVAFSVTGALVGIESDLSLFGVMVLAFVTASGGGILRDLLVNQVPSVLKSDFYGTIALLLGAVIFMLHSAGADSDLNVAIAFGCALLLRIVAYIKQWRLPRFASTK